MTGNQVHRAVSADGTEIVGSVHGQGPPLVLVHGPFADGESEWHTVLPFLTESFTCYTISTRCRGRSGRHDDLSPPRLVEDVTAFADSIGAPVRLFGVSGGAMIALGAAARCAALAGVVAWEPVVFEVVDDELLAGFGRVLEQVEAEHAAGRDVAAAELFHAFIGNDAEMAAMTRNGDFEGAARYLPVDLQQIGQATIGDGYSPTAPGVLEKISAPVLVLRGADSALAGWFADGQRFVVQHVPDGRTQVLADAGHLVHFARPEAIARRVVDFFTSLEAPA